METGRDLWSGRLQIFFFRDRLVKTVDPAVRSLESDLWIYKQLDHKSLTNQIGSRLRLRNGELSRQVDQTICSTRMLLLKKYSVSYWMKL